MLFRTAFCSCFEKCLRVVSDETFARSKEQFQICGPRTAEGYCSDGTIMALCAYTIIALLCITELSFFANNTAIILFVPRSRKLWIQITIKTTVDDDSHRLRPAKKKNQRLRPSVSSIPKNSALPRGSHQIFYRDRGTDEKIYSPSPNRTSHLQEEQKGFRCYQPCSSRRRRPLSRKKKHQKRG